MGKIKTREELYEEVIAVKRQLEFEKEFARNLAVYLANDFENNYFNVIGLFKFDSLKENQEFIHATNDNVKQSLKRLRAYMKSMGESPLSKRDQEEAMDKAYHIVHGNKSNTVQI